MKERLKNALWDRFGKPNFPAEWNGITYGGGKCSQRYWEYLFAIESLQGASMVLDIGCGKDGFLTNLLNEELDCVGIDLEAPSEGSLLQTNLNDFVNNNDTDLMMYDNILCISVLEHVDDIFQFITDLDKFYGRIILTFELSLRAKSDYISRRQMHRGLENFKNYYVTKMENCPIISDNSDLSFRPMGLVLDLK
jgi:hypothetical protein